MTDSANTFTISPELQTWIEGRKEALEMKARFTASGGHMSLSADAIDPELLPEPMRAQAIEHLRPEEQQREK